MHYNISRSSKLKSLANQNIIEKFSPVPPKGAIKVVRTHSLADSKKNPKLLIKTSKYPKPRIDLEIFNRTSKTPTPPNVLPLNFSESKGQLIVNLKNEISALKDSLSKALATIEDLKAAQEAFEPIKTEKKQLEACVSQIIHKLLMSEEVSNKFKKAIPEYLKETLGEKSKILEEIEKNHPRIELESKENKDVDGSVQATARFKSMEEFKGESKSEGIVMEDFFTETFGFLHVKAGDRVQLLARHDEFNWMASMNGIVAKVPVSIIFID